jgi:hypothetical protein
MRWYDTKRGWLHKGSRRDPILQYLAGTIDLGLYFQKNQDSKLIEYTDVGYLSDPHNIMS